MDGQGNPYVADLYANRIRKIDTNGVITAFAGTGKPGFSGDDGPALQATLKGPKFIYMDQDKNVLIADTDNHSIRKVWIKEGKITRLAGTGVMAEGKLGGDPLKCELNKPHGVYVRADGTLYICDSDNNRVLMIKR